MPLKLSSWKLSKPPRLIVGGFLVLSFLGFLDASYLAAEHYLGVPLVCTILNGCELVLNSPYAVFLGIPLAFLGALYYAAVFFLTLLFVETKNPLFLKGALLLPIFGFLFSLWLVYLQAFVLQAWCQYCLLSAGISTLLFLLSLVLLLRSAKREV